MNALSRFVDDLIGWYWAHGSRREGRYEIPRAHWLGSLYELRDRLSAQDEARQQERPAMAVWGPSQTGKSTLVSAFIDGADAPERFQGREGTDGIGTGLHWPGGYPMYFMAPKVPGPQWLNKYVLNPFNLGWDGSSCLTRFVLGSTDGRAGTVAVTDVQHPVQVHLISEAELLHVVARGYDTEALGPEKSKTRSRTTWKLDNFAHRANAYRQKAPPGKRPDRTAFEQLVQLVGVLDDMVFAGIDRYRQLLEEGEERWQGMLSDLLTDPGFCLTVENVEALSADLLWDSQSVLTDYYRRTRAELRQSQQAWAGKPVFCSMAGTLVLLNMAASKIAFEPVPTDPETANYVLFQLIQSMGWRVGSKGIEIGCGPAYGNKFFTSPERFSMFQGLVWELVVPLNIDHLPNTPFRDFLAKSDLLDFAGVGNEPKNEFSQIDLSKQGVARQEGEPQPFEPSLFFTRIIKRGKTASIVSSYAKRLTIDGFSIFQNIDAFPPVNANQLINGIQTWWKYMVPDYFREPRGPSPLPLNLGLMWWAKRLNEGVAKPEQIADSYQAHLQTLGPIGDREKATFFALNYYRFPRGQVSIPFAPDSQVYTAIVRSKKFAEQFRARAPETDWASALDPAQAQEGVALRSFREMAADKQTGGAGYFFQVVRLQLESVRRNPATNRLLLLEERAKQAAAAATDLLNLPNLFPPAETIDLRKVMLSRLQKHLRESVQGKVERDVAAVDYAVRELVDVSPAILGTPPNDSREVNAAFIAAQFTNWVSAQLARYDRWDASGRRQPPHWHLLGVQNRDEFRDTLEALVASVQPSFDEVARWLAQQVAIYGGLREDEQEVRLAQLRRHLAIAMGNLLARSHVSDMAEGEPMDDDSEAPRTGTATDAWQAFLAPFVEQQLHQFLLDRGSKLERPKDLPGEKELLALCRHYDCLPPALRGKV